MENRSIDLVTFFPHSPKLIYAHLHIQENRLDFERLLDASDYKEKFRADMIRWGEEKRNADPGYFCRIVCDGEGSELPLWIISDARRKTDVDFFEVRVDYYFILEDYLKKHLA